MTVSDRLTSAQAAELLEVSPAGFRSLMRAADAKGYKAKLDRSQWPNRRDALYSRRIIEAWDAKRPRAHRKLSD